MKFSQRTRTLATAGLLLTFSIAGYRMFSPASEHAFRKFAPKADTLLLKLPAANSLKKTARDSSKVSAMDSAKAGMAKAKAEFKPATLVQAKKFLLHLGRDTSFVDSLLADTTLQKYSLFKKPKPDTSKVKKPFTYEMYKKLYHFDKLLELGKKFQTKHWGELVAAQDATGVPNEMISAILGIESIYGTDTGKKECVNVFLSIWEDAPKLRNASYWSAFSRREFAALLKIGDKYSQSPLSFKGSDRGAIKASQFLPTSVLRYDTLSPGTSYGYFSSIDYSINMISRYLATAGATLNAPLAVDSKNYFAALDYNHSKYYARFIMELARDLRKARLKLAERESLSGN